MNLHVKMTTPCATPSNYFDIWFKDHSTLICTYFFPYLGQASENTLIVFYDTYRVLNITMTYMIAKAHHTSNIWRYNIYFCDK